MFDLAWRLDLEGPSKIPGNRKVLLTLELRGMSPRAGWIISFFSCSTKRLYSSTWRCKLLLACWQRYANLPRATNVERRPWKSWKMPWINLLLLYCWGRRRGLPLHRSTTTITHIPQTGIEKTIKKVKTRERKRGELALNIVVTHFLRNASNWPYRPLQILCRQRWNMFSGSLLRSNNFSLRAEALNLLILSLHIR